MPLPLTPRLAALLPLISAYADEFSAPLFDCRFFFVYSALPRRLPLSLKASPFSPPFRRFRGHARCRHAAAASAIDAITADTPCRRRYRHDYFGFQLSRC
jgi:hypothetical protein